AKLDERDHVAGDADMAAGRPCHAGDQLEERGLAGAIPADDAEAGATPHVDRHVAQRVNRRVDAAARCAVQLVAPSAQAIDARGDDVAKRARASGAVALADAIELDG